MANDKKSKSGELNTTDWKAIGRGLGVALAGAFLTYLIQVLTPMDFGVYTPIATAGLAVLANVVRKLNAGA